MHGLISIWNTIQLSQLQNLQFYGLVMAQGQHLPLRDTSKLAIEASHGKIHGFFSDFGNRYPFGV